jgi:hypothetical protein
MTVLTFCFQTWQQAFPELAPYVNQGQANQYFTEATFLLDNTDCSPVQNLAQRACLLNLLVAHIAQLRAPINGQASSQLVGRISTATEGSVSVSTELPALPSSAAYFAQTKYGLEYWALTANFRTMHYLPGRQPTFDRGYLRGWIGARGY